jgi:hypothetical protein
MRDWRGPRLRQAKYKRRTFADRFDPKEQEANQEMSAAPRVSDEKPSLPRGITTLIQTPNDCGRTLPGLLDKPSPEPPAQPSVVTTLCLTDNG